MAKDASPLQNLNVEAKQAIEQTVKGTEGIMDNYFNLLQQTMSATPWGKTDFGEKLKSFTEQRAKHRCRSSSYTETEPGQRFPRHH